MYNSSEIIRSILIKLESIRSGVPCFVLFSGIGPDCLLATRRALLDKPHAPEVDIIVHSPGGSPADAYRLIRTFRERYDTVNIIVPFWAKSAATLLAFGGSRIVLHEFGELGPLDAQIRKENDDEPGDNYASALNVQSSLAQIEQRSRQGMLEMFTNMHSNPDIKIGRRQLADMLLQYSAQFYVPLLEKIDTMEIGIMARYLDIGRMYANRILKEYSDIEDDALEELLDFLVYECPDHGYVIDYKILKPYLPSVMKASEPPFGPNYYKILERLSMWLMVVDIDDMVGFVSDLTVSDSSDTITLEESKNEQRNERHFSEPEVSQIKRPSTKPDKNSSTQEHDKNQSK